MGNTRFPAQPNRFVVIQCEEIPYMKKFYGEEIYFV